MKSKYYFCILLLFSFCFFACKKVIRENKNEYDFSKNYIEAAISTDNLNLTRQWVLEKGNSENYIRMALRANSLKVLPFLLEEPYVSEEVALSPYFDVRSRKALDILERTDYSPNVFNYEEETLVQYYYRKEGRDFLKYFLQHSKKIDLSSETKLLFELECLEDVELVQFMLEKKANFTIRDEKGNYPIYYATNPEVIDLLLDLPYSIQATNKRGENILGEVYLRLKKMSHQHLLEKIIQKGVNPKYSSYGKSEQG